LFTIYVNSKLALKKGSEPFSYFEDDDDDDCDYGNNNNNNNNNKQIGQI
jgi:hypothetical protein